MNTQKQKTNCEIIALLVTSLGGLDIAWLNFKGFNYYEKDGKVLGFIKKIETKNIEELSKEIKWRYGNAFDILIKSC